MTTEIRLPVWRGNANAISIFLGFVHTDRLGLQLRKDMGSIKLHATKEIKERQKQVKHIRSM